MPETAEFSAVVRRVVLLMAVLAPPGVALAGWRAGWPGVFGFLTGAGISAASFWLLYRMVRDIGAALEGRAVGLGAVIFHSLRMLLLGGLAYGILKTYEVSQGFLAAGLLLSVTAITLEALYEILYARA